MSAPDDRPTQRQLGTVTVKRARPAKMLTLSVVAWRRLDELARVNGTSRSAEVERLVRGTMSDTPITLLGT